MAILAEQIYMLIRNELVDAGITAYSDYIPDETVYPFVMYEIVSMVEDPAWAFNQDYELQTVRFNIYDKNVNPTRAIGLAEEIETLFNRTQLTLVDEDDGKYLICNHKSDDSITYLAEDFYWLVNGDYEFRVQRDI